MGEAMEPPAISFVTLETKAAAAGSGGGHRSVRVMVPRTRAYLAPLLAKAFEGRRDVEIVVSPQPGEPEPKPRPGARKRPKEEAIEIVIREPVRAEAPRDVSMSRSGNGAGRV